MAKVKAAEVSTEKMPNTIHLDEDELPAIKDWKVGEKYTIVLEVEQTGSRKGDMMGGNKEKLSADFKVISAKEGETPDVSEKSSPEPTTTESSPKVAEALRRKFNK